MEAIIKLAREAFSDDCRRDDSLESVWQWNGKLHQCSSELSESREGRNELYCAGAGPPASSSLRPLILARASRENRSINGRDGDTVYPKGGLRVKRKRRLG